LSLNSSKGQRVPRTIQLGTHVGSMHREREEYIARSGKLNNRFEYDCKIKAPHNSTVHCQNDYVKSYIEEVLSSDRVHLTCKSNWNKLPQSLRDLFVEHHLISSSSP